MDTVMILVSKILAEYGGYVPVTIEGVGAPAIVVDRYEGSHEVIKGVDGLTYARLHEVSRHRKGPWQEVDGNPTIDAYVERIKAV